LRKSCEYGVRQQNGASNAPDGFLKPGRLIRTNMPSGSPGFRRWEACQGRGILPGRLIRLMNVKTTCEYGVRQQNGAIECTRRLSEAGAPDPYE
jgi:hypothetical protein